MMVLLLVEKFGNSFVNVLCNRGFYCGCIIVCCSVAFFNFGVLKLG